MIITGTGINYELHSNWRGNSGRNINSQSKLSLQKEEVRTINWVIKIPNQLW